MQPGTGLTSPQSMNQQQNQQPYQYQYQYQQPPQQPPQQQQPYMNMMMMPPPMAAQSQPQGMWPPQIPPPVSAGVPPQQIPQQSNVDEGRTLWIGDLQYWMDENYLLSIFATTGEVASVKIIRNKQTNQTEGYGFIEFYTRAAAERILQTYNGTIMNGEQKFRLNWASHGAGERRADDSPDFTIFVGDLAADVTDYVLQETFRPRYPSVKGAKVVIDRLTGHTKGYGFVKFADESEQISAMTEMNGALCSTRPMRIGPATNKKTDGNQQYARASYQNPQSTLTDNDPNNTTIFVGGLDSNVTDDILKQYFGLYGELVHVKIPVGKRCAFVQFADKSCAEEALLRLNGTQLGGQNIRLSWGRSPSNKQPQADPSQLNAGMYGYAQGGYEGYGYTPAPQDPNVYYGYTGYGNYQQQQ